MDRRHPIAARIIHAWRDLTVAGNVRRLEGRKPPRTLVACSGGADSCALLLALAAATDDLVVAHVVHDLRPREQALGDCDAARRLAEALGLQFDWREAIVRDARGDVASNLEGRARRARYAALVEMARTHRCPVIATAHHADDQLETVLMAVLRGAGPRGFAGVPRRRRLTAETPHVTVVRPMLGDRHGRLDAVTRDEARALCRAAGWVWREDASNADVSLLRNALRARVLPVLEELRPGAAQRAARSGELLRAASRALRSRAERLCDAAEWPEHSGQRVLVWNRAVLRRVDPVVLGEMLRVAARRLGGGDTGLDRLSRRGVAAVVRAVCDDSTDPRRLHAGPLAVHVTARAVRVGIGVPSDHDQIDHTAHPRGRHQRP
jgi:tRNA(Ile)-lysidine synthase